MAKAEKKVVLVVDDNKDLLYSVKQGLLSVTKAYEVITVDSGKKCLKLLDTLVPDVILLDIMMPDMDGWDVCAKIKSNKKIQKVPVIFLTAKTDTISEGMGKLAAADYIEKPFDVRDLKKRLDAVMK